MDFQKLLLGVENALRRDDLKALTFLCADILKCNPNSVQSFTELFTSLMNQGLLSKEQPQLLTELLLTINQHRLVKEFELNIKDGSVSNSISPYRKLLYELSEYITDGDLKSMKFLLNDLVPRRKLEENFTTLDVFLEMERLDHLSDSKFDHLETIFSHIYPVLNDKINRYKTQQGHRLRSSSFPSESVQVSKPFLRTSSLKKQARSPGLGTYPMTSAKRGLCVILNNYNFKLSKERLGNREGTEFDEERLTKVFEWLSFEVIARRDSDSQDMLSIFTKLSKENYSEMDCLVCFILSHGLEGHVYGVDGGAVKIKDLMDPFDGRKCPSLVEKPKMFFIQACQGSQDQRSVGIKEEKEDEANDICSDAKAYKETIPAGADFLLGMATVPSYVSYREKSRGSWYIQSLCQSLTNLVPKGVDLISILTQVNADVSEKTAGSKKQMPQPAFSLRKKVVFPIPTTPPPPFPAENVPALS